MLKLGVLALLLVACGAESDGAVDATETGGSSSVASVTEATGGDAVTLATGGAAAMVSETGGATHATGGKAATGGNLATGGAAGCAPKTCREQGPLLSGLSSKPQTIAVGDGCGGPLTCSCQLVQGTGGHVGFCQ